MKAVLCKEYGPAELMVVEDVPALMSDAGQVVVAVHACGVNFPDNLIIQNKYQVSVKTPFSPGREAAGTIKAVGEGVTRFCVGDRVIAAPGVGGFAEEMIAREEDLFPLPEGVSYVDAAAFLITYATSYYALKERACLQPGESLLVLGAAGDTGLSAVELGTQPGNGAAFYAVQPK